MKIIKIEKNKITFNLGIIKFSTHRFCVGCTVLLIFLKLFKIFNINWLWIFSPIWLPLAILVILCLLTGYGIKTKKKKT